MGKPKMNRSAKGGARSSLHFWDEGVLIHPPHQGDCGQHGTEEQRVTSGELTESPGDTGVSEPISGSERARSFVSAFDGLCDHGANLHGVSGDVSRRVEPAANQRTRER